MKRAQKLECATEKLHGVIKEHLAQFRVKEQKAKWGELEKYLSDAASGRRAKPQGRRAKPANRLRSPGRAVHR